MAWKKLGSGVYNLTRLVRNMEDTVNTIKALLFLRENRPDITNADFLNTTHSYKSKFGLNLQRSYLTTLSSLNYEGDFQASFLTRKLRDKALTEYKVKGAFSLIEDIRKENTIDRVQSLIEAATEEQRLNKARPCQSFK